MSKRPCLECGSLRLGCTPDHTHCSGVRPPTTEHECAAFTEARRWVRDRNTDIHTHCSGVRPPTTEHVSDVVNASFTKGAAVPPLRLKPCGFPAV
jgi:hypothetical protein